MHPRVAGRRRADQLVERHPVAPGQRQQQLQGRPATAGLQPGQGADRDAGRRRDLGQRVAAAAAESPQPHADVAQHAVQVGDCSLIGPVCQSGNNVRASGREPGHSGAMDDRRTALGCDRGRRRGRRTGWSARPGAVAALGTGGRRGGAAQRAGGSRAQLPHPGRDAAGRAARRGPGRGRVVRRIGGDRSGAFGGWPRTTGSRCTLEARLARSAARPPGAGHHRADRPPAGGAGARGAVGPRRAALSVLPRLGGP